MKLFFKEPLVYVKKCSRDYSIKLGEARIENILPRKDGNYLKCRYKEYANLLPVEYEVKGWFKEESIIFSI